MAARLFRARKDGAFPPIALPTLLPFGDSRAPALSAKADLRLPGQSNSDSILNGERGFG